VQGTSWSLLGNNICTPWSSARAEWVSERNVNSTFLLQNVIAIRKPVYGEVHTPKNRYRKGSNVRQLDWRKCPSVSNGTLIAKATQLKNVWFALRWRLYSIFSKHLRQSIGCTTRLKKLGRNGRVRKRAPEETPACHTTEAHGMCWTHAANTQAAVEFKPRNPQNGPGGYQHAIITNGHHQGICP